MLKTNSVNVLEKLSLLLKVRVDIRKWKNTLETERNLCKIHIK